MVDVSKLRLDVLCRLVRQHQADFSQDFESWLALNPHVYQTFEDHAYRVLSRGRRHYSARTICEVIRHETLIREAEGWKINNNRVPDLARLFAYANPSVGYLFSFRASHIRPAVSA